VARYYFDIHDFAQSVRDDEGTELDSLDAAVQAAARSAAEIGTGRLAKGDTGDVVIGYGTSMASESAPSKRRWRLTGTSPALRGRMLGAHKCRSQHGQKEPGTEPGSLRDGHEHQHVGSSTRTPMKPFQNCRAGGSACYS
jgi:hypothetical protein